MNVKEKAIKFIMSKTELQRSALEKAQKQFEAYHVEAQNLLIAYIEADHMLLDTQTKREIALQQQAQYEQEAKAQEKRIEAQAKDANADKRPEVVAAMFSIDFEMNKAEAKRKLAEGRSFEQREVGKCVADAYRAQAEVIGPEATAIIKLMNEVGVNDVKITRTS